MTENSIAGAISISISIPGALDAVRHQRQYVRAASAGVSLKQRALTFGGCPLPTIVRACAKPAKRTSRSRKLHE